MDTDRLEMVDDQDMLLDDEEIIEPESFEEEEEIDDRPARSEIIGFLIKTLVYFIFAGALLVILFLITSAVFDHLESKDSGARVSDNVFEFVPGAEKKAFATSSLGEISATLADGKSSVNMEITVGYDDKAAYSEELNKELERSQYRFSSVIQDILSTKDVEDIDTVDERNHFLKNEIRNEINTFLPQGKIETVYFTKFFIFTQLES